MKYGRLALVAYAFTLSLCLAAAESIPSLDSFMGHSFPDNSDVRKQYWTKLITAPKEQVWSFTEKVLSSQAGQVKVSSVKRAGDFLVQFANSQAGVISDYSQGSYVVQRDLKSGYILQAKIFLNDDPSCYARLYPQAEGTRVDVIMYGAVIKRGLYVSGLIYYVLAEPFSQIFEETRRSFDWSTVFGIGERSRALGLAQDLRAAWSGPAAPALSAATSPAYGQPATPSSPSASVGSQAALLPSTSLPAVITKAAGADALLATLTAKGYPSAELAPSPASSPPAATASGLLAALAMTDDSDPLVPRLPYKTFPRYEGGKGMSLAGIRATIYLDSLAQADSAYALVGDSMRVLVAPFFDAGGHFRFAFFMDGRETSWDEVSAGKDKSFRVLRIGLGN